MAKSVKELRKQINKAGSTYKQLLNQQDNSGFFTKTQKGERKRAFLDAHVGLFDEYAFRVRGGFRDASEEARSLARDIGREFPESDTARAQGIEVNSIENLDQIPGEEKLVNDVPEHVNGVPDLQGRVRQTYRKRSAYEAVENETVTEEAGKKEDGQDKNLRKGVTGLQMKGIREVCAWMYNNTKKHQKFVAGVAGLSPREKLLIFYIVEHKETYRHNVPMEAVMLSQVYVPNVSNFEAKLRFRKHWYKFGGTNFDWDMVSDAVSAAARMKGVLGVIGGLSAIPLQEKEEDDDLIITGLPLQEKEEEDDLIITGLNGNGSQKFNELLKDKDKDNSEEGMLEKDPDNEGGGDPLKEEIDRRVDGLSKKIETVIAKLRKNQDLNVLKNDELPNMFRELEAFAQEKKNEIDLVEKDKGRPAGPNGNLEAWHPANLQRARYLGLVAAVSGLDVNVMKYLQKDSVAPEFAEGNGLVNIYAGAGVGGVLTIINTLVSIVHFTGLLKMFGTNAWPEITSKFGTLLLSGSNALRGGFTTTTTAASLAGASWAAGQNATAATLKSVGGWSGVAIGGVSTAFGVFNLVNASGKDSGFAAVNRDLNRAVIVENLDQQDKVKDKVKGKKQLLMNITAAAREQQHRNMVTSSLQAVQGALNVTSGTMFTLSGVTLGASGIVALSISGVALLIGFINAIAGGRLKTKEVNSVIDQYLGMDGLVQDFRKKNLRGNSRNAEEQFQKKYGDNDKIRENLREEAAGVLGFSSLRKMYSSIMWQYANLIYECAFTIDGDQITDENINKLDAEGRKLMNACRSILKTYGLKMKQQGGQWQPNPNAIYKKLIA